MNQHTCQEAESRTYTPNGALATLTDGNANVTAMDYDGFDRPDAIHYADGTGLESTESFAYDPSGNVTTRTTRAGDDIVFTYDGLNRLVTITDGGVTASYAYDARGRFFLTGFSSFSGMEGETGCNLGD